MVTKAAKVKAAKVKVAKVRVAKVRVAKVRAARVRADRVKAASREALALAKATLAKVVNKVDSSKAARTQVARIVQLATLGNLSRRLNLQIAEAIKTLPKISPATQAATKANLQMMAKLSNA